MDISGSVNIHRYSPPLRPIIVNNPSIVYTGRENNFQKYVRGQASDLGAPYDYGSLMHYGTNYFTKNGEDTIVPTDPNARIGQRLGLSDIDAWQVMKLYRCPGADVNPRE